MLKERMELLKSEFLQHYPAEKSINARIKNRKTTEKNTPDNTESMKTKGKSKSAQSLE